MNGVILNTLDRYGRIGSNSTRVRLDAVLLRSGCFDLVGNQVRRGITNGQLDLNVASQRTCKKHSAELSKTVANGDRFM